MIHAASLKSQRLQAVLKFLKARGKRGATTLELSQATNGMSISTTISELRHRGIPLTRKREANTPNGSQVHRYFVEAT